MSDRKVEARVVRYGAGSDVLVEDINEQNKNIKSDEQVIEEHKKSLDRRELKAKLVQVLDRGVTQSRLSVQLPDDKYGEWVANDKMEIYRMESMGFEIDREYASKRALHDGAPGGPAVVGDVVFMTCAREVKEVIDEIRREQYEAANNPKRGMQKEEKQFQQQAHEVGLPDQIKSRVDPATLGNIVDALNAKE